MEAIYGGGEIDHFYRWFVEFCGGIDIAGKRFFEAFLG